MITFSKLGEYGRLGNQLFQYAILLAIREKTGFEIKIPDYRKRIWDGQECLLEHFNITTPFLDSNDKLEYKYSELHDDEFGYNPEIFNIKDNTDIFGFFQNSKYYENCFDIISKELSLKDYIQLPAEEKIKQIKYDNKDYEIVSLHLRRGDSNIYLYGDENRLDKNSLWYKFFERAKEEFIGKKVKFLLFTGGKWNEKENNSDYDWCRRNFVGDEYIFLNEERTTINDFALMQLCDHHILSQISSFGWWVGYLNKYKKDKKIISPVKYYFLEKEMPEYFYPNEFILK